MPVVIELNQTRIREMGGRSTSRISARCARWSNTGSARAGSQSFLSNRRYVDLDIVPEAPPARTSPVPLPYPEIPVYAEPGWAALEADATKLLTKLQALDFEGLVGDLRRAALSFERAAGGVDAAAAALPSTLRAADAAIASVGNAARAIEAGVAPLTADTRAAVVQLRTTLERAESAIGHVDELVDPASPLAWQLTRTLGELQSTSRTLRHLAEELDRDPSALVRGRAEDRR
jgi:paraquat-inducible protein B